MIFSFLLVLRFANLYFFGDGCFFFVSLFKLVGESAPLPKPRKINASRLSASESLKTLKQKIAPPLASPRTLNLRCNNANVLLHEYISSKHINETCCSTSILDDTSALDKYGTATFKLEKTFSKSKDYTSFNKDQINQQKKISETIGSIIAKDTSSKSNQYSNHEIENNFDIQNSMKLIRFESEEEFQSKFEDKFSSGDKFNQEKKILDITDIADNSKSLNLNLYLSNKKCTMLDSIELNVSEKSLSSEYNIISKKNENNSLKQGYNMTSENIDSCNKNENQCDNSRITLDDSFLNESMIKSECMTELKNERLKALHHQFVESLNAQRKAISSGEIEENVEAINSKDTLYGATKNIDSEKKMCTVISTIPKCERLAAIREDNALNNITKRVITENVDDLCEKCQNYQSEELNNMRNAKRIRVVRSQSKSDDFEMDILKRQKRYLTLPPETIAHALNLNIPARNSTSFDIAEKNWKQIVTGHCIDHVGNVDIDNGESYGELITGA